jgi:osmotically-inducible protein OsmY
MLLTIGMKGTKSGRRRSDADVAYDVENALMRRTEVPGKTIRARVQDQWVWLVGECDFDYQREAAERAIENVAGLRGVVNSVHVKHR